MKYKNSYNNGDNNGNWVGDNISYKGLHTWLRRNIKKENICEVCGKKGKTDFASKTGEYKRDPTEFQELCRSCHMKSDKRVYNRDVDGRFLYNDL